MPTPHRVLSLLALTLLLGGCSTLSQIASIIAPADDPTRPAREVAAADAIPRHEPLCKYGNMPSYTVLGKSYQPMRSAVGFSETGIASWYGPNFDGKPTSCMETYDMYKMTAAHKTLPLPSYVEVTNLENNRKVVVRVNDRGPFHEGRIIDLSYSAAWKLDIIKRGTGRVKIRVLTPDDAPPVAGQLPYIQFGLFSNRQSADALRNRVSQQIIAVRPHVAAPVEVRSTQNGGRTLYQVLLQPHQNEQTVDSIQQQLAQMGIEGIIKRR
jgi:rare lipoprotein A